MIDLTCATFVSPIFNDSREHLDLTIRMMRYMASVAKFGHAILLTACEPKTDVPAEVIQIPPTDIAGLQTFQYTILPRLIRTPFMLMCHNDSGIIRPDMWCHDFLKHDFIGAPWGDGVVGNDGFSIQSSKFLWAKSRLPWVQTVQGDEYVCRCHRASMDAMGVTFAPFDIAIKFSTETVGNDFPSFGFHGRSHCAQKHKAIWQTIEQSEGLTPQPACA